MKKNKFLALTMLCSVLSGVSANAQEVENSGSQTTGEVKNSSGNKGTPNSDKNVEKVTKKDPNSKKIEGGNSSGSKKPDAKKGDKDVTKDKAKDSGEVSSKSFEWGDFKQRFGDGVSSFVVLVKRHPVWSSIIGISGAVGVGKGVRRKYFKNKKPDGPMIPPSQINSPSHGMQLGPHGPGGPQSHGPVIPHGPMIQQQPHGPGPQPHGPGPQPHGLEIPPPSPVGGWGVNKFGYNEQEDCIYRNPNEKIKVILVGSNSALKSVKKDKLVEELKQINKGSEEQCKVSENKISEDNLELINVGSDTSEAELIKQIKESGSCFVLFTYKATKSNDFNKYDSTKWKANVFIGGHLYNNVNFCNVSDFSTKK